MATALITGGSGLIGRWVQEAWDIDDVEPIQLSHADCDLLEPGAARQVVRKFEPDYVVHLAWCASGTNGYRTSADNERWLHASLDTGLACVELGCRFIATGSVVDRIDGPDDSYSQAKRSLRFGLGEHIESGAVTWIRPYYVFDPAAGRPRLVSDAVAARGSGSSVALDQPNAMHDFVHAADVGSAVVEIIRHHVVGQVDVGTGELRRVSDLVDALGVRWTGPDPEPALAAAEPAADRVVMQQTGWSPTTTIQFFHTNEGS